MKQKDISYRIPLPRITLSRLSSSIIRILWYSILVVCRLYPLYVLRTRQTAFRYRSGSPFSRRPRTRIRKRVNQFVEKKKRQRKEGPDDLLPLLVLRGCAWVDYSPLSRNQDCRPSLSPPHPTPPKKEKKNTKKRRLFSSFSSPSPSSKSLP